MNGNPHLTIGHLLRGMVLNTYLGGFNNQAMSLEVGMGS